ncbi:hypothetical protein EYF80_023474 [Liparis tanakae]|uniref:Uncharacterized protein n=1 Tax=Liparis tanakae TaxID=230148 RepID=A0A4Z2HKJ7_9TELE|nr:hypothetical protein EYF80_023474 [Liparis tanakae]
MEGSAAAAADIGLTLRNAGGILSTWAAHAWFHHDCLHDVDHTWFLMRAVNTQRTHSEHTEDTQQSGYVNGVLDSLSGVSKGLFEVGEFGAGHHAVDVVHVRLESKRDKQKTESFTNTLTSLGRSIAVDSEVNTAGQIKANSSQKRNEKWREAERQLKQPISHEADETTGREDERKRGREELSSSAVEEKKTASYFMWRQQTDADIKSDPFTQEDTASL